MTIYGIRHHGPGCARSLKAALEADPPDIILLESPAETESLIPDATREGMEPPVAMLVHEVAQPQHAAFYPLARFSPEWQAILWATSRGIPVRCFDLPAAHTFALDPEEDTIAEECQDPFRYFAEVDGYTDGERWWNDRVEERGDSATFFAAILEAVTTLREELAANESSRTLRREAWMRRVLRATEKEGFQKIAVVCGAWHAPALIKRPPVKDDDRLLKGLAKVKVAATWAPWTHERLTSASGYGAGVRAPGWYDHLWSRARHPFTTWMTKAARVLRKEDLEGSSASIIEATRLAHSLAGLRGRPRPGLDESLEAMQTVFCAGDASQLALLKGPLLVGKQLGNLPDSVARLPLQADIEAWQKRLRLKPSSERKTISLDLREENARRRSLFLHRLLAIGVPWGRKQTVRGKGTFKESWELHWKPELVVDIIDAAPHGNTLAIAAQAFLTDISASDTIGAVTEKLDLALLAHLPEAAATLLTRLDHFAAASEDTAELLTAVPPLARITRYGDVRQTDVEALEQILTQITTRIHIGLPMAASGLDAQAAATLTNRLRSYSEALDTLQASDMETDYLQALQKLATNANTASEPRGYATRMLRDRHVLSSDDCARLFRFAMSSGNAPAETATWLEGFLRGSGALLIHDQGLLAMIHAWMDTLTDEHFQTILPLVRRTFGTFTSPERGQIGHVLQTADLAKPSSSTSDLPSEMAVELDLARALPVLSIVADLLELPSSKLPKS